MFPKVEVSWDFNFWHTVSDVSTVGTAFFRVKQSILRGLDSEDKDISNRRNVGKYWTNDAASRPIRLECSYLLYIYIFFFLWRCGPTRAMASSFLRVLDHTQRRITFGRTLLDEWSARRRDLYLTTHNTHNRQTSMPPVGFEPTISAGEQPQTYAWDRAATGTGMFWISDEGNTSLN